MYAFALVAGIIMGALIMIKGDQQMVGLLGGKLRRLRQPIDRAHTTYWRYATWHSSALFAVGMGMITEAVPLWIENMVELALMLGIAGGGCCCWAMWQKVRAFLAADAELAD